MPNKHNFEWKGRAAEKYEHVFSIALFFSFQL